MSVVRVVGAAAIAVAGMLLCGVRGCAATAEVPSFLLFGGTDLWRYGQFLYGGALWSPAGIDADGFTLKLLVNGGRYSYVSGDLQTDVHGTMASGAVMPGWRFIRDGLTVSVFAGPVVQDYRLSPYDPGSRLHGLYSGGQLATDIWYQPRAAIMVAVSGALASIGPTGFLRTALGYRIFDAMFVGPEAAALWCGDFQQVAVGGHVTAWRLGALEWSAGGGIAIDSDKRTGPYLRLGVSTKF
ncbi:MAG TPA: cellulose biosynthesis protein BcsS [Xanthobacteraceae bacterium]|nr:cellulose biosynthesis protein BcsS [Xanthobacteraceae bacterium]